MGFKDKFRFDSRKVRVGPYFIGSDPPVGLVEVLRLLSAGSTADEVCARLPQLSVAQVRDALEFAAEAMASGADANRLLYREDGSLEFPIPQAQPAIVAMLDILGSSRTVMQADLVGLQSIANRYLANFLGNVHSSRGFEPRDESLRSLVFSDSIAVWCRPPISLESLQRLVHYVALLTLNSLQDTGFGGCLPIRGAIAAGEAVLVRGLDLVPMPPVPMDLIIGKPILQAYRAERAQEWIGTCISRESEEVMDILLPGALKRLEQCHYLVRYPVPVKRGCCRCLPARRKEFLVVNFVPDNYRADAISKFLPRVEALKNATGRDRRVAAKYAATCKFIEHVAVNNLFAPLSRFTKL